MSRYQKTDLITAYIRDIFRTIVSRNLAGLGGISTNSLISNIELGNSYIKFDISKDAIKLMDKIDIYSIKDYLSALSKMWKDRVFEGTNGYYMFGDIVGEGVVETDIGKIKSLRFPFYKVSYSSYLDDMLDEVKVILIPYLGSSEVDSMNILYPKFGDDSTFLLLISKEYSNFYKILMSVYQDLKVLGKKYITPQILYASLKEIGNVEKVSGEVINQMPHSELNPMNNNIDEVLTYYIAKKGYPYIYSKIIQRPQIGNLVYDMKSLTSENLYYRDLFDYFKTGVVPPNLTRDITFKYDPYLIYLLLLDDTESNFASYSDYLGSILDAVINLYYGPLFDKLGISELIKITEAPRPQGIRDYLFERVMSKIVDYVSEKEKAYIKAFGTERLKILADKYNPLVY